MSKRATALARCRWVRSGRVGVLLCSTLAVGVALGVALAGCAGSGKGPGAGGSATAGPSSAATDSTSPGSATGSSEPPCKPWSCTPEQAVQLGGGYSVRLWSSAAPTSAPSPDRSTPVLQLLQNGKHLQWWVGRSGFGWATKLDCLPAGAAAAAHCAVLAEVGSHAGTAELVLLRSGVLDSPAQAIASFDGGRPMAADLDHNGWLDVLGTENDYQPNYATGHNFWATYRFDGASLHRTGCTPRPTLATPQPERLLTGACPVVSGA
ncbi:MAG: hypothetical protein ABI047_05160 [Jatrophihabitantaceae bacterium]